ncbi:MAG: (2Fe-2S)-binding protein [SAR324 cluster bacterium]|nr:(2Fe-2S)-binding protein [SAR324 cluster bacterium]
MTEKLYPLTFTLNGSTITRHVTSRLSLADFLRTEMNLTGTHVGCEHGVCGACTIRVEGRLSRSCLMFAIQVEGMTVETVEGLNASGELHSLQEAFHELNALQCGFCTPGILITAAQLLQETPLPSRKQIRDYLSGNYCRCTGYHAIVDAVEQASQKQAERR